MAGKKRELRLATKLAIASVAAAIVGSLLTAAIGLYAADTLLDRSEHRRVADAKNHLLEEIGDTQRYNVVAAQMIANMPLVRDAMAAGARATLAEVLAASFDSMRRDLRGPHAMHGIHFHTTDLKSLLRMHEPERWGDDLSRSRPMLLEVQEGRKPVSGIESGASGIAIRSAAPILAMDQRYVGSVEVLTRLDDALLEALAGPGNALAIGLQDSGGTRFFARSSDTAQNGDAGALRHLLDDPNHLLRAGATGAEIVRAAFPLPINGGADQLIVEMSVGTADLHAAFRRAGTYALLWLIVSGVLSAVMAIMLGRGVSGPLLDLAEVLRHLADGKLGAVPHVERRDEVGEIARRLRALSASEGDRQRAEQALADSESQLRLAIDAAGLGVWRWDSATGLVSYSERSRELLGQQVSQNASFEEFLQAVHPLDRERFLEAARAVVPNTDIAMDYRVLLPDGGVRWLQARGRRRMSPDGKRTELIGVQWDVSEHHQLTEELRASEHRRHLAMKAARLGIWEWNARTDRVVITDIDQHGAVGPRTANLKGVRGAVHPDDLPMVDRAREESLRTGNEFSAVFRVILADGGTGWTECRGRPTYDADGTVTGVISVQWDVSEQYRLLEDGRRREAQLRSVLAAVPDAVIMLDGGGTIVSMSTTAQRMFDTTEDLARGAPIFRLLPSSQRDQGGSGLPAYLLTDRPQRLRGMRRDGTLFPAELTVSHADAPGGRSFIAFVRDLSERERGDRSARELQAQLFHASRLSSMGQTASALAHELNQPLAAIANYLEVAQAKLAELGPPGADFGTLLTKVANQATRATTIVRRIRGYVEKSTPSFAVEHLPGVLAEALELALVGQARVKAELHTPVDLPPVRIDRIQIQQVLVNLLRNGAEAASESVGDGARIQLDARLAANAVEITVSDNGPGVDAERRRILFSPFNSSKANGMGIGLSVSRAIVEAHGGRIWVDDAAAGSGACFHFTVPLAEAA